MILIFNSEPEWENWLRINKCPEEGVCVIDLNKENEQIALFLNEEQPTILEFLREEFLK